MEIRVECPPGQHVVLVSISYTNVQVSGGGDTETIPRDVLSHLLQYLRMEAARARGSERLPGVFSGDSGVK